MKNIDCTCFGKNPPNFTYFLYQQAILKVARKDLLNQDFEGLMKYFRVNIPKTYRNEENAKHLV